MEGCKMQKHRHNQIHQNTMRAGWFQMEETEAASLLIWLCQPQNKCKNWVRYFLVLSRASDTLWMSYTLYLIVCDNKYKWSTSTWGCAHLTGVSLNA